MGEPGQKRRSAGQISPRLDASLAERFETAQTEGIPVSDVSVNRALLSKSFKPADNL